MDKETIGKNVRRLRQSAELTQNELADKTGLYQPTISAIERGHRNNLTQEIIRRIALGLGVDVSELFKS